MHQLIAEYEDVYLFVPNILYILLVTTMTTVFQF